MYFSPRGLKVHSINVLLLAMSLSDYKWNRIKYTNFIMMHHSSSAWITYKSINVKIYKMMIYGPV